MWIFIDESGTFAATPDLRHSVSCVVAFAVPEGHYEQLAVGFEKLVRRWGMTGEEPKGRLLAEAEISDTVTLLERFDVILKIAAIDIGMHLPEEVRSQQDLQSAKLVENLTDAHHPNLVKQLHELKDRLDRLPSQLFVQAVMMIEAVDSLYRVATLQYALTLPEELASFKWTIDAKGDRRTEYEDLWLTIVSPALQSSSLKNPVTRVSEGDYTHFERFNNEDMPEPPRHLRDAVLHRNGPFSTSDVKKIMEEHLRFEDSTMSIGLQIADILANAFRRACNGRLGRRGWRNLGRLVVRDVRSPYGVPLRTMSDAVIERSQRNMPYRDVFKEIDSKSRTVGDGRRFR